MNLFLQSQPLEEFYRIRGKLLEFDLPGGIPESWPKLLQALNLEDHDEQSAAAWMVQVLCYKTLGVW